MIFLQLLKHLEAINFIIMATTVFIRNISTAFAIPKGI